MIQRTEVGTACFFILSKSSSISLGSTSIPAPGLIPHKWKFMLSYVGWITRHSRLNHACHVDSVEDVYELEGELGKGAFSVVRGGRHRVTGQNASHPAFANGPCIPEYFLSSRWRVLRHNIWRGALKQCLICSGSQVAIKIIPSTRFKTNVRAQAAIRNEVEAMRRIRLNSQNPCLIAMLGVYSEPAKVSIVLERLDGGELFERIVARGHYTERDASQVLYKLTMALADCHKHGILHRDVKPENVLYVSRTEDAEIKLTDFGLAMLDTEASVLRRDDNLVGTPGYVAPEVLSSRLYGPPCDVWALGVITYILLVGYPPFFPTDKETLFEVIKKGRFYFHPDAWDTISSEAKHLVRSMLTVDLNRRATMASIFAHPWMSQQAGLPAQHLSGTISRLKAFNAKRKWRAVASVVMLGAKFGLKKRVRADSNEGHKAHHDFTALELDTLKQAFYTSAEGEVLSRTQLAAVLSDIGFGPVPSDRLFDLFDADGNGQVDCDEFLTGISSFRHSGDKALRFCFDVYDRDGVGAINLEQLKAVLSCVMRNEERSVEQYESESLDEEERLTEMFKSLDVDGNGTIDFEEFKAGVKREPMLVRAFLAPVQQGSLLSAPVTRRRALGSPTSGPTPSSKYKEDKVSTHASGNSPEEALVEGMGKSDGVSKESTAGYRQAPNEEWGESPGDGYPGRVDAYDAEMLPDRSASECTTARQMRALSTNAEVSTSTAEMSRDTRDSGRGNPCDGAGTETER